MPQKSTTEKILSKINQKVAKQSIQYDWKKLTKAGLIFTGIGSFFALLKMVGTPNVVV